MDRYYFDLSLVQKEIYKREQYCSNTSVNNNSGEIIIDKNFDYKWINNAINTLLKNNNIIRLQLHEEDTVVQQYVADYRKTEFPLFEFETLVEYNEWVHERVNDCVFGYDRPLYNFFIIKLKDANKWSIVYHIHHILVDALGSIIISDTLIKCLELQNNDIDIDYHDYDYRRIIANEQKYLESKAFIRDTEYWKQVISEYDGQKLSYQNDSDDWKGKRKKVGLSPENTKCIKEFCDNYNVSIPCFFYAVFAFLKSRLTYCKSSSIALTLHNRGGKEKEAVGMFVTTLPLIVDIDYQQCVIDYINYVKSSENQLLKHHRYTYGLLQNICDIREDLFDFGVSYQLFSVHKIFSHYQGYEGVWLDNGHVDRLSVSIRDGDSNGQFLLEYAFPCNKYKEEFIDLLHEAAVKIIEQFVEQPEIKISEIDIISEKEKNTILNEFNTKEADYPRDKTVVELFEDQVQKTPNNTALVFEDKSLTYAELNERANRVANKLAEIGVKSGDYVALYIERSLEMVIGIYGIIKAGGIYVPINTMYPEDRVEYILKDCGAKVLLVGETELNVDFDGEKIDLKSEEGYSGDSSEPKAEITPESGLYVIYTSGTTGMPKGVEIMHKNVVRLMFNDEFEYDFNENDVWTMFHSYGFDFSVWEMYGATLYGGKLIVVSEEEAKDTEKFIALLREKKVTVLNQVPTAFYNLMLVDNGDKLDVRYLIFGGEALNPTKLRAWRKNHPECRIVNMYGITETTVHVTYREIGDEEIERGISDIGKAIPTLKTYIMNGNTMCGIGIPGELCVTGDGLARGYLNRPELTEEKFVKNPFGEGRMYRSGDLARWLPDGNIEYLGRIDEQVKIRGFRIELGEIETRIREIEGIKDCAVIARADSTGDKAIYAYYTSDVEVSVSEIRDRLSVSMPEYMVPAYMMQIDSIPVTRNGKLDKRALPEIETKNTREYVAPRNAEEAAVCKVFSEILNVEQVGVNDSFFELGGDSIKAIRIISSLRNAGYTATVKDVMNGKTAEKIALAVKTESAENKYDQGEVTGKVESTPIIKEFGELNLAKPEHFNQSMMFPVEGIGNEEIKQAIEELVKHHDVLRAVYRNNGLEILPVKDSMLYDFYEFDYSNKADKKLAVHNKCTEIQASIDLANGPLVKIAIFELGDTKQMMFCIHHLAVDGVSWRILSEDFETAVSQIKEVKKVQLPEKTASFIEWSKKLKEYGEKLSIKDKEYWKKAESGIAEGKIAGEHSGNEPGYAIAEFSKETTEKLLTKSSNAYGAKIDEVLIAGLARAVERITGQKKLSIKLEGHGREEIHEPISIDRTVGWFTNIYAVSVEASEDNDTAIISAKDTLRGVPDNGMGYGFTEHENKADICFNYLGDFSGNKTSYVGEYSTGADGASENKTDDKIVMNGQVSDGKLMFSIVSQTEEYGQDLITRLTEEFKESVEELARYCAEEKHEEKTASDYGINDLTTEEFAEMQRNFTGEVEKIYGLTALQEGMLFHNLEDRESTGYVVQSVYNAAIEIEEDILRETLRLLSIRYDVLRTSFIYEKISEPKQVIYEERVPEYEVTEGTAEETVKAAEEEVRRGFDLAKDTMLRVKAVNTGEGKSKIILTIHHIVMDGWCFGILVGKLFEIYFQIKNGERIKTIEEGIREERRNNGEYSEYLGWLSKQDEEKAEKYWEEELECYENNAEIKAMKNPEPTEEQMKELWGSTDEVTTNKLKILTESNEATINTAAETAVGIMLQRYSGSNDVVFGKVVSGRNAPIKGIENMVGLFINTIPVRVTAEKDTTVTELIKRQQEKGTESTNYDYYSLAEIQKKTVQGSDLIKVLYVYENYTSGLNIEIVDTQKDGQIRIESLREQTNYGITISGMETDGKLCFKIMYDPHIFRDEEMRLVMERLLRICEEMAKNQEGKVFDIEAVTESEKQQILNDFNATISEYPRDKTVAELFEEQVERTPDNTALVFKDKSLTYAELNAKANSLAHKLREIGVKPDDFVAIIADKSIEMICGIYGIIKAGGAYVPIDPTYPEDRISFMLEDCKPKAVLKYTTESITIDVEIPVIDLANSEVWEGASENLEVVNKPGDAIYCIYTSGTTGKPKGVIVEHRNVVKLVKNCDYTELNEETVILQTGQLMFDASTFEMWGTSLNGGTLHLVEKETMLNAETFKKYMTENGVNTLFITTALFNQFMDEDKTIFNGLKHLMFGGEATSERHVEMLRSQNTGVDFRNVYGPTETTTFAAHYIIDKKVDKTPIGRPISNTTMYVMNGDSLCGIGIPGELCIGGDGVARGYLNRPELTAEKFVKNPFGEGRMYRSGDLVRWLPDGNIEFLGRIDEQVKIRGFRIELGEIESRIREIEGIKECAVIARADSTGDKAIYAYYTSDSEVSVSEIRDRLSASMPEYMVPAYMMQIEAIPVTRNGKLDRRALPEIGSKTTREYAAPKNAEEEAICKAFSEILNVEQVGVKDSFFELGGDSIKAIRIISKLRNAGYTATVKDVMNGKTAEKIALAVKTESAENKYEQGEVTGKVESTPIIKEFGEWNLAKPEHFNQSMMFPVEGIGNEVIKQAIEELVKHHDILRAVYRNNELEILPIKDSKLCDFYEFDYSSEADKKLAVFNKCTEIQGSIDLENGPLVKIAVFELGETKQMMFCIHHLAVDGVSWRILSEDFETAVEQIKEGKKVQLPEKTASFIEWSKKLKEYGEKLSTKDKEYWKKAESGIAEGKIAREYSGDELVVSIAEFSKETTETLLKKSNNAYGAKIDEILIAGLARAVGRVTGQKKLAIKLEGHGREEIHEPISIDRTVGWFTNIYVVSVDVSEDNDTAIISAKDTMRSVPNNGMGYGFTEHDVKADICFNYLGDFSGSKTSYTAEYSTGSDVAVGNMTDDKIVMNGQASDGIIKFFILSKCDEAGKKFIENLKNEFVEAICELSDFCRVEDKRMKTITDLRDKDLEDDELDVLNLMFS